MEAQKESKDKTITNEKLKKKPSSDQHKVTFSVTVVKAFPTAEEDIKPNLKGIGGMNGRRRVFEAPKPQHYFHLEYRLLPAESDAVKADLVTYGVAAKIYMETDSKVLKTWKEGDLTWVAWTHSHKLTISRDVLLKMYNHTMELKIWDTKDKVSPRARFDRPKAFRLPGIADDDDDNSVKSQVVKQMMAYDDLQPKPSFTKLKEKTDDKKHLKPISRKVERKVESFNVKSESNRAVTAPSTFCSTSLSTSETPPTAVGNQSVMRVQVRVDEQQTPQFGRLAELAGVRPPSHEDDINRDLETSSRMSRIKADERTVTPRKRRQSGTEKTLQHKQSGLDTVLSKHKKNTHSKLNPKREMAAAAAAHVRSHGLASVSIKLALFFSGMKSCTTRLDKPSGHVRDLFLTLSVDKNLLSESQKKDLNPMVIHVNSACNMPNVPLTYEQLKARCKAVFLDYRFFDQPRHQSAGREHGSEVYWRDIHVVLLGTINKEILAQCLHGPPLTIEVHDRDRKDEKSKVKASLFGEKPEDEMINNVALVAGRRTTHNPFKGRQKTWDPYGIAKFDLSGLLLGQRVLELRSSIQCCPIPDTNLGHENPDGGILGQPRNIDGPEEKPMPSANYLESGSELKIKIEVAYPLNKDAEQADSESMRNVSPECPFGRIVYIFQYTNSVFLHQIQSEITAINAEALELETLPKHVIEAALSTYKLSEEQRKSKTLDIITGFQVLDGEYHMFVLEGLSTNGLQRLWTRLPRPPESDQTKFNVLYNSEMLFSDRLYASLDVDLCRVRLHEPLTIIVQNPLLYVRDLVPKPCFSALSKLDKLLRVTRLREATRGELFPSAEMVISMSREFGIPLTAEDFGELDLLQFDDQLVRRGGAVDREAAKTSRVWTPIADVNESYEQVLKERLNTSAPERDFIKENIMKTKTASRERPKTIAVDRCDLFNQTAHNYSIQTLNSTELAKEKLRQILSKERKDRFTYCFQNNSAIVLPIDPEAVKKTLQLESFQKLRTPDGFVYPGKKTSLQSNAHPKKPDSARLEELHKPWKENVLHANKLKPTVNREIFSWPYRDKDFDLHLESRDIPMVRSIHAAGDIKEQEQQLAQALQAETWRSKVVVEDPVFRTHRCLTTTELHDRGPRSSNQLAKLKGLLKDPPTVLSLKKPGITLGEIPPLGVVSNPNVETFEKDSREVRHFRRSRVNEPGPSGYNPGPFENEGWLLEKNKIPIHDREHKKYKELRGQDFWLYHKERDVLYRRRVTPLLKDERDNNLFPVADTCS